MEDVLTKRNEAILRAARTVFARFGVAKTTMGDVAEEAGVSRQTVYNAFPGKTELLRATTRLAILDSQEEMRVAWAKVSGTTAKVDVFFELGPLLWFDLMQTSPAMAEVFEGMNEHAKIEVAEGAKTWVEMLEGILVADGVECKDPSVSRADLAEFFYFASVNAKYSAESRTVLEARLKTIKSAFLNMLI